MRDLLKEIEAMNKVCPFLASGWLTNKYASMTEQAETWKTENLPKCLEENCMAWEDGRCALIRNTRRISQ